MQCKWQIFVSKIDKKKNVLREVNFTNLKITGDYIVKLKIHGVQITQTLGSDYAIWPNNNKCLLIIIIIIKFYI